MLTDAGILARRVRYRCCELGFLNAAIEARIHGDQKCYEENKRKWLWMSWAADIMQDTPVGDEDGCTLLSFATDVADKADCLCDICGCETATVDCTITPDFTVLDAVAYEDLSDPASEGDAYYVLTSETINAGRIATWTSGAYVFSGVPNYSIVLASDTGVYYTTLGVGPGLLFPNPLLTQVLGAFWAVETDSPQTEQSRTIQLQGLGPNGWYNMSAPYTEGFPYPTINLTGLPFTAVRFLYTLANGCQYYSGNGTFVPPVVPPLPCTITPDFTVAAVVDANQEGLTGDGYFFIATDQYGMGNAWAANLGSVVTVQTGLFTYSAVLELQTVYAIDTLLYWRIIGGEPAPLFPALTATFGPEGYLLESDWINASLAGTRYMIVEGEFDGSWIIVWAGYEYDLPQQLADFGVMTAMRATYIVDGCATEIAGTVVIPDTITVTNDCSGPTTFFYRYVSPAGSNPAWIFDNGPTEIVRFTFLAGEIRPTDVVSFYEVNGPFTLIGSSGGATDLASLPPFISNGPMLMQITQADADMPPEYETWWWQIQCGSDTGDPPTAYANFAVDCDQYTFDGGVEVTYMGSATELNIEYTVDGGPPALITGITAIGNVPIGTFGYDSVIVITIIDVDNPTDSFVLGAFTGSDFGPCDNPCLPDGLFKIDGGGDLADLPDPGPFNVYTFFVASDVTGIGTWPPGTVIGYYAPGQYEEIPYGPGLIQYGDDPMQIWQGLGPSPPNSLPYPIYPQMFLTPTGNSPNNWSLACPSVVEFAIPLNTPFQLQVRNGMGPWESAGDFTLQQLTTPQSIPIVAPFTSARTMWNEGTCGLGRPVFLGT